MKRTPFYVGYVLGATTLFVVAEVYKFLGGAL